MEELLNRVSADLENLNVKISEQSWLSDEVAFAVEQCLKGVAENPKREKMEAFRGILTNSLSNRSSLESIEREFFIHLATNLSTLHLLILSFLDAPESYLSARGISASSVRGGFRRFFPIAIPNTDIDAIRSAFGELHELGMVNSPKSVFDMTTAGEGLTLLGDRLTDFGKKFVRFCSVPEV